MLHIIIIGRKISRNDCDIPVAQILLPHQIRDRPRRKMHFRRRIFRNVHGNLVRNPSVALPAAAEEILLQMKQGAALFKTRKGRFSEDDGRKEHGIVSTHPPCRASRRLADRLHQSSARCKQIVLLQLPECTLSCIKRHCQIYFRAADQQFFQHPEL